MKNPAAVELGKSGGLKKSDKKTEQCRKNAKKPRGRWVTAMSFEVECRTGRRSSEFKTGVMLSTKGKDAGDLSKNYDNIIASIEDIIGFPVTELREFSSVAEKI